MGVGVGNWQRQGSRREGGQSVASFYSYPRQPGPALPTLHPAMSAESCLLPFSFFCRPYFPSQARQRVSRRRASVSPAGRAPGPLARPEVPAGAFRDGAGGGLPFASGGGSRAASQGRRERLWLSGLHPRFPGVGDAQMSRSAPPSRVLAFLNRGPAGRRAPPENPDVQSAGSRPCAVSLLLLGVSQPNPRERGGGGGSGPRAVSHPPAPPPRKMPDSSALIAPWRRRQNVPAPGDV